MSNVGVFVDLALAAVLLIALVMGWRQGFVQALTRLLVVVAALLLVFEKMAYQYITASCRR